VEAVGACTRALARSADADALLAAGDAASIGSLRAYADRLAVRRRFHDPEVHAQHRPAEARAAGIFDALELARLDALGVRWYRGVAKNLLDHPGAAHDAPRWLAFECLTGRVAPPNKTALAAGLRARMPAVLVDRLAAGAGHLDDQPRFAAESAAWAREAAAHIPPQAGSDATPLWPFPRTRLRHLPRRGDAGGTAAPLAPRRDARQGEDGDGTASGANVARTGGTTGYRVYTTAYDRVVDASSLASRAELAELRLKLEAELSAIRPVIARLAKRLLRVLMARQAREWRFDLEEGVLDGSRLAPLVASRGAARPFKQESDARFPGTVVTLLIDHSGSMRGRPMLIAALTVEVFARVLERCGVKCEVLGFTTREWDGGAPAREWAAQGYPGDPGRLNALEHIVIKSADVPWRRAHTGLGLFLRDEMLKENIDGEALAWAHDRLLARTEPRRILVVVSDGTPMDEATMAANGHEYLEAHLQAVVEDIERRSAVRLAAIGIGHDVSAFYGNATRIARIDELGPALTAKLIALLGSG
jgi:cobaltochelatase CobT